MRHLFTAFSAATFLIGSGLPAQAEDYSVWDHFAGGYYAETNEAGDVDCTNLESTNWVYIHPDRRENATIPGVFSTFDGWLAFHLNGQEEDYFLDELGGYGFDLPEAQQDMIRNFFDGLSHSTARGVALSGGGLGYTTGGSLSLNFGYHIETHDIHIVSVEFADYGRTRDIVTRGEDNMASGFLLDGRQLRPFRHCPAE